MNSIKFGDMLKNMNKMPIPKQQADMIKGLSGMIPPHMMNMDIWHFLMNILI